MNTSIESTRLMDVMTRVVFTVKQKDKISAVATRFAKHDINAAPVVDDNNVCIGIITSRDLADYESMRINVLDQLDRRLEFDSVHHSIAGINPFLPASVDEVRIQMTSHFATVDAQSTLENAARIMCQKHVHHLVILDEAKHPAGMLSSLDILSCLTGEPVFRKIKGS